MVTVSEWYADYQRNEIGGFYAWYPVLSLPSGRILRLPTWFDGSADCEDFIRNRLLNVTIVDEYDCLNRPSSTNEIVSCYWPDVNGEGE